MIDLIGTLRAIRSTVNQVFQLVNAIFTLQESGGTITTTGAEQDVYRVEAPMGIFEPLKVQVDLSANAAGDVIVLRTYYRIVSGGNLILKEAATFAGVQATSLKNIELEPNRHGVQVTLQRTAGGAKAYPWAAFYRG